MLSVKPDNLNGRVIAILALIWTVSYVALGLLPFRFNFIDPGSVHLIFVAPMNSFLNWIYFVPLGMLIALNTRFRRPILIAGAMAGALSFAVESLQVFLPGRYASLTDLVLNTTGAIAGAYFMNFLKLHGKVDSPTS